MSKGNPEKYKQHDKDQVILQKSAVLVLFFILLVNSRKHCKTLRRLSFFRWIKTTLCPWLGTTRACQLHQCPPKGPSDQGEVSLAPNWKSPLTLQQQNK